jgi:hypothetical protein
MLMNTTYGLEVNGLDLVLKAGEGTRTLNIQLARKWLAAASLGRNVLSVSILQIFLGHANTHKLPQI